TRTNQNLPHGAIASCAHQRSRLRLATFVGFGLILVWGVLTKSFIAYLADTEPQIAARLRPTYSAALLNLAQERLDSQWGPKKLEPIDGPLVNKEISAANGIQGSSVSQDASDHLSQTADVTTEAIAQIHSLAERALLSDPLNARAFSILGQLSQSTSDVA